MGGTEHRRSAERAPASAWGFFEGGFDLSVDECRTGPRAAARSTTSRDHEHQEGGLHSAPPAVPVLHLDGEPEAHPADFGADDRADGMPANHQYDTHDFFDAINAGNFPAVSFLKAPGYQDGHAGYSDPLDEQTFIVDVINFLQQSAGMGEHRGGHCLRRFRRLVRPPDGPDREQSTRSADALTAPGQCGDGTALPCLESIRRQHAQGRCGYGPRLPLLVISPWAKPNYVDHTMTDQSSIIRFIEDNWLGGQRIGSGSFDGIANSIDQMFDFRQHPIG